MKRIVLLFLFQLLVYGLNANPVLTSEAYISEIYFDEDDDWTIEIYFNYLNEEYPEFKFYTSAGSADIIISFTNQGIVLITAQDLSTPLPISRDGDFVYLTQFEDLFLLCETVTFGNYPGSDVNAPLPGESLVNVEIQDNNYFSQNHYWLVKDIAPSLGYINEPVRESFSGYLVDNTGDPISYLEIDYGAVGVLPKIWTDENGYFHTDSMYCKNYVIQIGTGFVLEYLTIEFGNPVIRDYQYDGPGQVQIDGNCYLLYAPELEGTTVYFRKNTPVWVIDSAVTNDDGYFNLELDIGSYSIIYTHEYHYPNYNFEENIMFADNTLQGVTLEPGFVKTVIGNIQHGIWDNNYLYWILGDVIVEADDTLKIESGCEIDIKGDFIFDIYGALHIEGNEGDSVYIEKEAESWNVEEYSIHFNGPQCNNSYIQYAVFNNSGAGIRYFDATINVSFSQFNFNDHSAVLYGASSPIFDSVIFKSNMYDTPIMAYNESVPIITKSSFLDCGSAIYCYDNAVPQIRENFFDKGTIMILENSAPVLNNNVFYNCIVSLSIHDQSEPSIQNNIFYKNNSAITFHNEENITEEIKYNAFWNNSNNFYEYNGIVPEGIGELVMVNNNADSCDIYYNIYLDPLFVDTLNFDFHLTEFSPCIDGGNPEFPLNPDSTIADIGVYYYYHVIPSVKETGDDNMIKYFEVYPNPANSEITISYELASKFQNESATLKILNMKGNEIGNEQLGHKTKINLNLTERGITPGTYLFILESGGKRIAVEKVIIQ